MTVEERLAILEIVQNNGMFEILERLDAAEKSLRKQRALNEELWAWCESDCSDEISESLYAAFVDALK